MKLKRAAFFIFSILLASGAASGAETPRIFGEGYAKLFAKPFTTSAGLSIRRPAWSRKIGLTFYYLDPQRSLVRLTGSQRDMGTVALRSGGQVYFYFPRAELRLGLPSAVGALPLFGSDFSADDLLAFGDIATAWIVSDDGTETLSGVPARRYELKPRKPQNAAYGVVRLWVARDGGMPLREEFFSPAGALLREVTMESDGRLPFPTRWHARTYGPRGGESELQFHSFDRDRPIRADLFTVEGLRQWR
jgi:hypothetical protein